MGPHEHRQDDTGSPGKTPRASSCQCTPALERLQPRATRGASKPGTLLRLLFCCPQHARSSHADPHARSRACAEAEGPPPPAPMRSRQRLLSRLLCCPRSQRLPLRSGSAPPAAPGSGSRTPPLARPFHSRQRRESTERSHPPALLQADSTRRLACVVLKCPRCACLPEALPKGSAWSAPTCGNPEVTEPDVRNGASWCSSLVFALLILDPQQTDLLPIPLSELLSTAKYSITNPKNY